MLKIDMWFKLKSLGFSLISLQALLASCSAVSPVPVPIEEKNDSTTDNNATPFKDEQSDQGTEVNQQPKVEQKVYNRNFKFNTSFIPEESDIYRKGYDLTFTLNFTSFSNDSYGTGWLIDWKGDENTTQKQGSFFAYIATNLHVADGLRNIGDHWPYSKTDDQREFNEYESTVYFSIGKYTNKTDITKLYQEEKLEQRKVNDSLLSIQTSNIPKTAYTATNFLKGVNSIKPVYADFAVIELELNLENLRDWQIFNEFIKPAINTYKSLGDSTNIFETKDLEQHWNHSHYLLGYPVLERGYDQNRLLEQKEEFARTHNFNQKSQLWSKNTYLVSTAKEIPVITKNARKDGQIGSEIFSKKTQDSHVDKVIKHEKGIVTFQNFKNFKLKYHDKEYQQYGYGLMLDDTNLPGGSSGSAIFNNNQKINSIYFGVLEVYKNSKTHKDNIGMSQLLRTSKRESEKNKTRTTNNRDKFQHYDLIFGDSNTKSFYAQFAKKHNTHLYDQIKSSEKEEFKYVDKNNQKTPFLLR
ncbi:DUF31 family protein [Mycoplasmoides genitalium]|uniref:Uncharacterized lipoprotein MG395 n=2 Tax=Mycoplasmoides genitalium TaxID=2097 RepID=Y395_MYCGE|nr:DUF31 family protein [Mycoplasmoides genitalium]P47635.1 RecName: Full=Uncharacterized lipoprotein MG395; Flags: Precursor [Mycoplasmoides genitalium G37]AAC71623.1 lipoprotein, putative [Mycoplasmoides genitalium G37]ABY79656.1 lipoprotein, putative [synthetic Mycoplasma genitalium JCVI-1.0]AFQ04230.1 lipoprotein [Mycoplasmoides genitalium M6320]